MKPVKGEKVKSQGRLKESDAKKCLRKIPKNKNLQECAYHVLIHVKEGLRKIGSRLESHAKEKKLTSSV